MTDGQTTPTLVRVPPGTESVVGVFVNGVHQREGQDYEVTADGIHFLVPLEAHRRVTGLRRALLAVGIGVYDRGDTVDLHIRRAGRTEVVQGAARPPTGR